MYSVPTTWRYLVVVGRSSLESCLHLLGWLGWAGLLGYWATGLLGYWATGLLGYWARGATARLPLRWVCFHGLDLAPILVPLSPHLTPYPSSRSLSLSLPVFILTLSHFHSPYYSLQPLPSGRSFPPSFLFLQPSKRSSVLGPRASSASTRPARHSSLTLGSTKIRACSDWGGLSLRNPTQHHPRPPALATFSLPVHINTAWPATSDSTRPRLDRPRRPTRHDDRPRAPTLTSPPASTLVLDRDSPASAVAASPFPVTLPCRTGQPLILHDPLLRPNFGHRIVASSPWTLSLLLLSTPLTLFFSCQASVIVILVNWTLLFSNPVRLSFPIPQDVLRLQPLPRPPAPRYTDDWLFMDHPASH
ncbi:hypothetical protein AK830_g3947 [Neonectria ditissima]|uniref:Uncharacterized protein n=1 Tax=Neonectria ditissima TaxID=78410 RepID=A0A0P7BP55_9HYPO|nr:hypothetical protein AK830_g3947 [Neonectria ditissima]